MSSLIQKLEVLIERAFAPLPGQWKPSSSISLSLAGILVLADLPAIATRTALKGTSSLLDILVLCPGAHRQLTASELHRGEYPAVAAMTTGYVFRVENPATVFYLQQISRTAHLTTLSIIPADNQDRLPSRDNRALESVRSASRRSPRNWMSSLCYLLCVLNTLLSLLYMSAAHDVFYILTIILLVLSRFFYATVFRHRAVHTWSGASEPGVRGDLLVLLSQDRWVRMRGLVDGLKAVTSGSWLQPATVLDGCLTTTATLCVYLAVVTAANATVLGQAVLICLLVMNLGLLALSNHLTVDLNMFGRLVVVESVSRRYGRRLEMAEELIEEMKRDDWAVKLGMIGADKVKYSKVKEGEVIM